MSGASDIPIAAGENEYTKHGFRELIVRRAADVLQPDVTRVGGVTEWRKVAAMAEAEALRVAPHAVHELHVHLAASVPNCPMIEFFTRVEIASDQDGEIGLHSCDVVVLGFAEATSAARPFS